MKQSPNAEPRESVIIHTYIYIYIYIYIHTHTHTHTHTYEGQSTENLKSAIKIRSTARLSVSWQQWMVWSGREVAVRCRNATRRRSSSVKMAVPLATCNLRFSYDSTSFVCVFVCVYIYIYIYIYTHTHTHIYIYIYTLRRKRPLSTIINTHKQTFVRGINSFTSTR